MKRLERFDPIAVLDTVNALVDWHNAGCTPGPATAPKKTVGVRQVAVMESTEPAPAPAVDPKVQEVVGSYTNRAEAALNVAINRLVELKDTATVERIHRIWRRS